MDEVLSEDKVKKDKTINEMGENIPGENFPGGGGGGNFPKTHFMPCVIKNCLVLLKLSSLNIF